MNKKQNKQMLLISIESLKKILERQSNKVKSDFSNSNIATESTYIKIRKR